MIPEQYHHHLTTQGTETLARHEALVHGEALPRQTKSIDYYRRVEWRTPPSALGQSLHPFLA
jgi:hypothetical protein